MSETDDTEELCINYIPTKIVASLNNNIQNEEEIIKANTIELISDLLNNICEENKTKKEKRNILIKQFTNNNIPSISIKNYLMRLTKHSKIGKSTIIIILIYIDRICKINNLLLTYYNIHKLFLASFILAIKYNEDQYYSMFIYSKIGGVSLSELNKLEFEFIKLIGFNLFVPQNLYDKYYNDLMSLKSFNEEEDEDYDDGEINDKINIYEQKK